MNEKEKCGVVLGQVALDIHHLFQKIISTVGFLSPPPIFVYVCSQKIIHPAIGRGQ